MACGSRLRRLHAAALSLTLLCGLASAGPVAVPMPMQSELLAKVVEYDRNLRAQSGDCMIVLLVREGLAESELSANQAQSALRRFEHIGGRPRRDAVVKFRDPAALREFVHARSAAIVYIMPGLDDHISPIAQTLAGTQVLTVAAVPRYVESGAVLGFDLVSGRAKLLINVTAARRQHVLFKPELLKLAKVYR